MFLFMVIADFDHNIFMKLSKSFDFFSEGRKKKKKIKQTGVDPIM